MWSLCVVCQIYLHPFGSVFVVNSMWLHAWIQPTVQLSFPATGGTRTLADARKCGVRVAQHHAGGLVDAGGVRVDGGVHLQNHDAVPETLGFASDALNTAHHKQHERPAEHSTLRRNAHYPLSLRRTHTSVTHTDPLRNAHQTLSLRITHSTVPQKTLNDASRCRVRTRKAFLINKASRYLLNNKSKQKKINKNNVRQLSVIGGPL